MKAATLTAIGIAVVLLTQCASRSIKLDVDTAYNGITLIEGTRIRYDDSGNLFYIYPIVPLEINDVLFPEQSKLYLNESGFLTKAVVSDGVVIDGQYYYPGTLIHFDESGAVESYIEEGPSDWPWF